MRPMHLLVTCAVLLSSSVAFAIVARDYRTDFYAHRDEIRACAGSDRGSVTLRFSISPRGALERSRVAGSPPAEMRRFGECVLRRARGWRFQPSTSGRAVVYELTIDDRSIVMRPTR